MFIYVSGICSCPRAVQPFIVEILQLDHIEYIALHPLFEFRINRVVYIENSAMFRGILDVSVQPVRDRYFCTHTELNKGR